MVGEFVLKVQPADVSSCTASPTSIPSRPHACYRLAFTCWLAFLEIRNFVKFEKEISGQEASGHKGKVVGILPQRVGLGSGEYRPYEFLQANPSC